MSSPAALALSDARVMTGRELRRSLRSIDALLTALIIPIMILSAFVFVFGGAMATGSRYVDYVVPGILVLCAGFGSASTALGVSEDMVGGTIARFRTMAIFPSAPLVGHVSASVVRNAVASTLVVGFALLYGFRPDASVADWVLAAGLLGLFIVGFTWISCAVGLLVSPDAANGLTFVMIFLPYLSSGFVPPETMPSALHAFAAHQPLTPIIETLRHLLTGTPEGGDGAIAVTWCLGLLVVGYTASAVLYRRPVKA